MFMSKKLQNIHLIIIPILFLITLIYSIVTLCTKRDSQNWYSFVGQIVLVAVWIFANIGLKKVLKNKAVAIILANVIFQLLLAAHIFIYIITEIIRQALYFEFAEYLFYCYIFISFVAMVIMIYDLIKSVTDINIFKNAINIESEKVKKLNKVFLAIIPTLIVWVLLYSLVMLSFDIMYILLNGLALILIIAIWISMNLFLTKHIKNKKLALIISQIIFQVFLWMCVICFIVLTSLVAEIDIVGCVYLYISFTIISISALVVLMMQLKIQNVSVNNIQTCI